MVNDFSIFTKTIIALNAESLYLNIPLYVILHSCYMQFGLVRHKRVTKRLFDRVVKVIHSKCIGKLPRRFFS